MAKKKDRSTQMGLGLGLSNNDLGRNLESAVPEPGGAWKIVRSYNEIKAGDEVLVKWVGDFRPATIRSVIENNDGQRVVMVEMDSGSVLEVANLKALRIEREGKDVGDETRRTHYGTD